MVTVGGGTMGTSCAASDGTAKGVTASATMSADVRRRPGALRRGVKDWGEVMREF
jgi:hypothetical protein